MGSATEKMKQAIVDGDLNQANQLVPAVLQEMAPVAVITDVVAPAMNTVGDLYSCGEYYVPEMLLAARAAKAVLASIRPLLTDADIKPVGTVVVGTVQGDLHDIGKNLVAMMLEGAGFRIVDLGIDVSPDKFIQATLEHKADMVGLSALLSTTIPQMEAVIKGLEKANIRQQTRVLVGGAPVTDEFARSIGADGYAPDAAAAVRVAKQLLGVN